MIATTLRPPLALRWKLPNGVGGPCVTPGGTAITRVVEASGSRLVAVDSDGAVLWKSAEPLTPLLLPSGDLLALEEQAASGQRIIEPETGRATWRNEGPQIVLVHRDLAVSVQANEEERWTRLTCSAVPPRGGGVWARTFRRDPSSEELGSPVQLPLTTDGTLLFVIRRGDRPLDAYGGREGEVWALDLRTGEDRWRFPAHSVDGAAMLWWWTPEAALDKFFFHTSRYLVCLEAATGKLQWTAPDIYGQRICGDHVYWAHGTTLGALRLQDGSVVYQRDVAKRLRRRGSGNRLVGFPAVSQTHVFRCDAAGALLAFQRETGDPAWECVPESCTGFIGMSAPVIVGARLYVASFSMDPKQPQHLYCFEEASEGEIVPAPRKRRKAIRDGTVRFEIVEVLDGERLTEELPYHERKGSWKVYRCMAGKLGGFCFALDMKGPGALSGWHAALWVTAGRWGLALEREFRRALGEQQRAPEPGVLKPKPPLLLDAVDLGSEGRPRKQKWTTTDGGVELLMEWDEAERKGAFREKDETYRRGLLELLAGLVTR